MIPVAGNRLTVIMLVSLWGLTCVTYSVILNGEC